MTHQARTMIATNRFGLGARPGEPAEAASDPSGWLLEQLNDRGAGQPSGVLRPSDSILSDYFEYRAERRKNKSDSRDESGPQDGRLAMGSPRAEIANEIEARNRFSISTPAPFRERLVRFWSNHFTVSATNPSAGVVAGAFEREAIRPRVTGPFIDMLVAAETHPAMLLYLDNAQSVGPGSRAGQRRGRGLNENLAREILELHTVGVDGGYSQDDVVEFARALTGWTVGNPRDRATPGKTWFDERRHEPGKRSIMGQRFAAADEEQALAVLRYLAAQPATAGHIATKLARHFIADQPPASAVSKLKAAFLDSGGHLGEVCAELVRLDEAWGHEPAKFKTPDEFHLSALRGLGVNTSYKREMRASYGALGQAPFSAPSPAGWPDREDAWLGPDAVMKRLEWSQALAGKAGTRSNPRGFLDEALGALASDQTRFMVNGADSREQGLTLALMSPEFQRR